MLKLHADWYNSLTPEEKGWMLENNLRLVRNQELARRLFKRITNNPIEIAIALKSYKKDN